MVAQALEIELLELDGGALRSFVAVVSDKAVHSHVCVAGVEEIMAQRLAGGDAEVGRELQHAPHEIQREGAGGCRDAVLCTQICGLHAVQALEVLFRLAVARQALDVGGGGRPHDRKNDVELVGFVGGGIVAFQSVLISWGKRET